MSLSAERRSQDRLWPAVWVVAASIVIIAAPPGVWFFLVMAIEAAAVLEVARLISEMRGNFSAWLPLTAEVSLLGYWPFELGYLLRNGGHAVVALVIYTIFAADVCALYGGRRLGHHKLAPRISPGKTIEGVVCALFGGLVAATVIWSLTDLHHSLLAVLTMTNVLVIGGIAGDLLESWIKRLAGQKDSGQLLRGHGGVLDRIDALVVATLLATIFVAVGWL